ncbi:MAG: hypothetical protein MZU91_02445 [Desulfosudis oleivorans]|nr:hypothetical protein [Desulfosudis oleivorans]
MSGFFLHICATAGNHGHGTIVAPDVIVPNAHKSLNACTEAWHMPMSSVWMMTARVVSEKPNFLRNGFGFMIFLSNIFRWLSRAKPVSKPACQQSNFVT